MTLEQILQMKKDLENLEKVRKKAGDIQEVSKHIGAIGRCNQKGVWQNSYHCKLQAAIQYTEGGNNYWDSQTLNNEFAKTVGENFQMLLDKTIHRVNLEYQKELSNFEKYTIQE